MHNKTISLGFPYYSENTINVDSFSLKLEKKKKGNSSELLTLGLGAGLFLFLIPYSNSLLPLSNSLETASYYAASSNSSILTRTFKITILGIGFKIATTVGGLLLYPPSPSAGIGYVIGIIIAGKMKL
jgi:hypothetical protein